jgi:hypothetical protein
MSRTSMLSYRQTETARREIRSRLLTKLLAAVTSIEIRPLSFRTDRRFSYNDSTSEKHLFCLRRFLECLADPKHVGKLSSGYPGARS